MSLEHGSRRWDLRFGRVQEDDEERTALVRLGHWEEPGAPEVDLILIPSEPGHARAFKTRSASPNGTARAIGELTSRFEFMPALPGTGQVALLFDRSQTLAETYKLMTKELNPLRSLVDTEKTHL